MSSDSGVQFIARRRKRPRQDPSETPNGQSSTSDSRPLFPPSNMPPTRRYPGDGFDFRRPVTSSAPPEEESEVIDLTNEPDSPEITRRQVPESSSSRASRPPRFSREDILDNFIDLADDDEVEVPSSPEVQFVSSNTRPRPPPPPPRMEGLMSANFWRMLPALPQMFRPTNEGAHRREIPWRHAHHLTRPELETLFIGDSSGGPLDLTIDLDDGAWGFLGITPERDRAERERPRSTYKPPSPAPEGFTRNVEEDDVATCPNCDEELGMGDETKQQIWVSKQCGHVFCGECASNRSLTKARKSNAKTKPFSRCPVPDCGKLVSAPKAMFQVYL
ncbi:putative RING finger domain protein [Aspergillus stella-maris]|uniref:putative RING finger domain protein n=1 Tax=Aspergillus stella-maris TaxID=1810926 RepID=UPI003CCC97DA